MSCRAGARRAARATRCDALRERAVAASLGAESSVFVSHSWHDSRQGKWAVLKRWAERDTAERGTAPLLWLDAACVAPEDAGAAAAAPRQRLPALPHPGGADLREQAVVRGRALLLPQEWRRHRPCDRAARRRGQQRYGRGGGGRDKSAAARARAVQGGAGALFAGAGHAEAARLHRGWVRQVRVVQPGGAPHLLRLRCCRPSNAV
mmetsp:Transcript_48481/g.155902  ORF Transcript_48481/g.155902 Transcript_48481/m.155902 type:complete len:206 (+) Transcript_48481:2379-2996(+)